MPQPRFELQSNICNAAEIVLDTCLSSEPHGEENNGIEILKKSELGNADAVG